MEKLKFEIELSKEELDVFNRFIEQGCIDREMYLKRLILRAIERQRSILNRMKAGEAKKTA